MDYYSFFRFMKNIIFNLKCITKYLCYITIFIAFIVVCLLLMSCKSYAAVSYEANISDSVYYGNTYLFPDLPSVAEGSKIFISSNNFRIWLNIIPSEYNDYIVYKSGDFLYLVESLENLNNKGTWIWYELPHSDTAVSDNSSLSWVLWEGNRANSRSFNWGESLYCNFDIYNLDGTLFFEAPSTFTAPSFVNYDDSRWGNTLVNGEFNYFYIDGNDCESLILYFGDITYANTTTDFPGFSVILDSSSPYYYGNNMWAIDKTEPFGVYLNNHTYQLSLQYQRNDTWESVPYRWTTDFSQSVIDDQDQSIMGNIDKGISGMNSFFNDKSFNEQDITNKLPSPPTNEDITANGFNNIFDTLRQTFTTNSDLALVFHIPFSDGNITIPANLTENIVPDILKNLIRLVYWYLISRFIVKDIASYIEKAKNGTITDGTDTNIKTDML